MRATIYKLSSPNCEKVYVGSTTRELNRRLSQHKHDSINYKTRGNKASKLIIDSGDYKIEALETVDFTDKKQLLERETFYQENLNCICYKRGLRTDFDKWAYKQYYNLMYQLNNNNNLTTPHSP